MSPNIETVDNASGILKHGSTQNQQSQNQRTIDYVYYVEWRQFAVPDDAFLEPGRLPANAMEMINSRALIGDFHDVLDELRNYHGKVNVKPSQKPKKHVRFQTEEKLFTSIPDVLQGCDILKIDKVLPRQSKCIPSHELFAMLSEKQKKADDKNEVDEESVDSDRTEEMLSTPSRNCLFIRMIKKRMSQDKIQKLFRRRSRRVAASESIIPTSQKKMERSSSYCRHDDADNDLFGSIEFEEIDDDIDSDNDDNVNPLS